MLTEALSSVLTIGIGVPVNLNEFLARTNNLQMIDTETIRQNPASVKFVRVLLGLFQSELGKMCGKEAKRISEYELGLHSPTHKTAQRLLSQKNLQALRRIRHPEDVYEKNLKMLTDLRLSGFGKSSFTLWAKNGLKTGFQGAEDAPATEQEKFIYDKLKKFGLQAKMHATIVDKNSELAPISVDLFIEPHTFVLLRKVTTKSKQNLVRHASQLALDGFRLKKRKPQARIYCVFEAPKIPMKVESVLNESMDWWTSSSSELINRVARPKRPRVRHG